MRASRQAPKSRERRAKGGLPVPVTQSPIPTPLDQTPGIHISGAEGIYFRSEIRQIVQAYINRAVTHPRGKPDRILITIEELKKPLRAIKALPVMTVKCNSTSRAETIISQLLKESGVSMEAIASAFLTLQTRETMRGASLVLASSGRRVEPDMQRGIRASRFGLARTAEKSLAAQLDMLGINTQTVREALVLASRVASCRDVIAEVCISDDPDYTTGYVASGHLGYVRIPHSKRKQDHRGGRVFFLREDADLRHVIRYLEKTPVIIDCITSCSNEKAIHEILDRHNQ